MSQPNTDTRISFASARWPNTKRGLIAAIVDKTRVPEDARQKREWLGQLLIELFGGEEEQVELTRKTPQSGCNIFAAMSTRYTAGTDDEEVDIARAVVLTPYM